jgi:hypothetical protein
LGDGSGNCDNRQINIMRDTEDETKSSSVLLVKEDGQRAWSRILKGGGDDGSLICDNGQI